METTLRALFIGEGALGPGVMGHARAQGVLRHQLATQDVDARFASLPAAGPFARAAMRGVPYLEATDLDLHTVRWHLAQGVRARRVIDRELARGGPFDVLHVHSHTISFLSHAHMRRIPTLLSLDATVWQWHEMGIWRDVRPYSKAVVAPSLALEKRALESASAVLAFSSWCRRDVERRAPRARVIDHHPGIDLDAYRPVPKRPRQRSRVLFVGGRFAEKGGPELLDALCPLIGTRLDLDVVTPARVEERPGLRVHRLSPGAPALAELFQQADIFCLPTRGDAVPFAVLEAMACGAAVVATDVGGIPDLLDGGDAGRLVKVGDGPALHEAVTGLIDDPALRETLAGRARARCEQRFDAARQTARLIDLMREVAAAGPPA